jgi:hypothetical protein
MLLITQVLTAGEAEFGIGRGGPKKQPGDVQLWVLPVSEDVVGARVKALGAPQVTLNSEVAPSGVGEGGCAEPPPPM